MGTAISTPLLVIESLCKQVKRWCCVWHTEYTHVILSPRGCQSRNDAQKVPSTLGDKQHPRALFLCGSCLKYSANELLELYRFFSQGGKESQGDRTTCQTTADLRVLTEGTAISLRGLDRDKVFLQTGGCCADTQSRTQSYPRAQGLLATQPLLRSRPSLSSDKRLLCCCQESPRQGGAKQEHSWELKCTFCWICKKSRKLASCSVAEGRNATEKTILFPPQS